MTFFHSYLAAHGEASDATFQQEDEAALAFFLLQARLHGTTAYVTMPDDVASLERLPEEFAGPELEAQIKFVAGFLCFFVGKPAGYMRDMRQFRAYFLPQFGHDNAKQMQMATGLRPRFFEATLRDLETATSLDLFFDTTQMQIRDLEDAFSPAGAR